MYKLILLLGYLSLCLDSQSLYAQISQDDIFLSLSGGNCEAANTTLIATRYFTAQEVQLQQLQIELPAIGADVAVLEPAATVLDFPNIQSTVLIVNFSTLQNGAYYYLLYLPAEEECYFGQVANQ